MKTKTKKKKISELEPRFLISVKGTDIDDIEKRVEELKEHPDILKHLPDLDELAKLHDADTPDEDFFKYLQFDIAFTNFPFAREKIRRWRNEARGNDKYKAHRAKMFLNQIGETLSGVKQNKKFDVANLRSYIYERLSVYSSDKINVFLETIAQETGIALLDDEKIRDLCLSLDEHENRLVIPRLANLITAKLYRLSEGTVKQYLKEIIEVEIDDHTQGFALPT